MQELTAILAAKREREYDERKFFAAIQGIDIDKNSKSADGQERGQKEWEDLKARVFSRGKTKDSNDITSLQGINAQQAGFGIGMGIEYASVSDKNMAKNPLRP
jgi:hypothetical protein